MATVDELPGGIRDRPDDEVAAGVGTAPEGPAARPGRDFFRWSLGIYLTVTAVLVLLPMPHLHWHYVYVLDDPAIHLSIAQNLVHHGTWGVAAGHYQSASSSPVWTLLLAVLLIPLGWMRDYLPLLGNVACGVGILYVLSRVGTPLRPALRRPAHIIGVFLLVVMVLFLPGLAVVGMEHSLHCLMLMLVVLLFERKLRDESSWGPAWLPYALLAVAMLTRFETAFVALGLGLAILLRGATPWSIGDDRTWADRLRQVVLVGLSAAVPLAAYAAFNRLMGQGLLPNSVLYKSQLTGPGSATSSSLRAIVDRTFQDPLLSVFWVAAVLYLVACRPGRNRNVVQASVLAVATPLHVILAQIGWYERYQSYLVVLGVMFLFSLVAELAPATGDRAHRHLGGRLAIAALVLAIPFAHYKIQWTWYAPGSSVDMYRQHYLAGKFLGQYYDGKPVATGELGYISLLHQGGITDFYGLGDYEVLRAKQQKKENAAFLADLARKRGFDVAAMYPITLGFNVPKNWILVGNWNYTGKQYTAIDRNFQFWATTPQAVKPLEANLRAFAAKLPPEEHLTINALAEFRAAVLAGGGH